MGSGLPRAVEVDVKDNLPWARMGDGLAGVQQRVDKGMCNSYDCCLPLRGGFLAEGHQIRNRSGLLGLPSDEAKRPGPGGAWNAVFISFTVRWEVLKAIK